jgi:hypothetical protein
VEFPQSVGIGMVGTVTMSAANIPDDIIFLVNHSSKTVGGTANERVSTNMRSNTLTVKTSIRQTSIRQTSIRQTSIRH